MVDEHPLEFHEDIHQRTFLYRIGHSTNSQGLWYDSDGVETRLIDNLTEGAAAALPMGPDPIFREGGYEWISCANSLETLRNWFSFFDMIELLANGHVIQEIEVSSYRVLTFPTFSHEVYRKGQLIGWRIVSPGELYPSRIVELSK